MALRIDIEVDLTVRKVVEALLNSSNEVDAFSRSLDRSYTLDGPLIAPECPRDLTPNNLDWRLYEHLLRNLPQH